MVGYRVREYTRDVRNEQGEVSFKGYWVYCSGPFRDYYYAIQRAIDIEKESGIPNWVEMEINYN